MPLMRRGPLVDYPVDWVLRQAAANETTGSIEFNSSRPMTVYVDNGHVYHAIAAVVRSDQRQPVERRTTNATQARDSVVNVLAGSLTVSDGWYYHDPLSRHEGHGPWQWTVEDLLVGAQSASRLDQSLGPWARIDIDLRPSPDHPIALGADAWAVVVELTAQASTRTVRNSLGWSPERLVAALDDLARAGAVEPAVHPPTISASGNPAEAGAALPFEPPSTESVAQDPVPQTTGTDQGGDRRSALRRLIANLRPA